MNKGLERRKQPAVARYEEHLPSAVIAVTARFVKSNYEITFHLDVIEARFTRYNVEIQHHPMTITKKITPENGEEE